MRVEQLSKDRLRVRSGSAIATEISVLNGGFLNIADAQISSLGFSNRPGTDSRLLPR